MESVSTKQIKIYYSGSIKGVPETDKELPYQLVKFMMDNRVDVLSEHVAGRSKEEMEEIRSRRTGKSIKELSNDLEPWLFVRSKDLEWVDEADALVALVNSASHGVGMEIQRAIDKPKMGMKETPILCLIREDLFSNLTWMIKGINNKEAPKFVLKTYKDLEEAKNHIKKFLENLMTNHGN